MPSKTPDQLKATADRLRKKLQDKQASLDAPKVRALSKRIRRAQRRRRTLVSTAARRAGAVKEKKES